MKKAIIKLLKNFFRLDYEGNRIIPCIHIKLSSDGKKCLHFRLPVWFNRKRLYSRYTRREIQSNKIVCDNYMGKPYGCNPKYVVNKLLEKYADRVEIVWVVSPKEMAQGGFPENVRLVPYGTKAAKQEYATAKVWLSNYHKVSYVKRGMYRRPGQYFIQMWHGSLGIKKIENNVSLLTENDNWLGMAKESSEMTTHWISNSSFETDIYKQAFWGVENILEYGHPRNDLLINGDDAVVQKVKKHFGIEGKKVMFYAPTFREDYRLDCYRIDFASLKQELEQKFGGEWVFVVRLHPRVREFSSQILPNEAYIVDGTFYPDIQELILTADSMITDYSSCIFDFLLTRRPGFIFATDIAEYNTERGFYYPLESTPFPVATSNEALLKHVRNIDLETYAEQSERFLQEKGCIEDGKASERVADLIMELLDT